MRASSKLPVFIKKHKTKILIVFALLIFISVLIVNLSGGQKNEVLKKEEDTFSKDLEKKIEDILTSVEGVGRCEVMVYVYGGAESVYARDESVNSSGTSSSVEMFDGTDGEEPVVVKRLNPEICGVVVVCDGGESSSIKNSIKDMLSVLLGIDPVNVSVSKRK